MGIESTTTASNPPSCSSIVIHTRNGWFVTPVSMMRGLIASFVPAVTSCSVATSVPTHRAW